MARKRQRPHGTGSLFKRGGRGCWIGRWFDHGGTRREVSTRTTDRAAAERCLAKRIADSALRRDGVIDARSDRYAEAERRTLREHIADWEAALVAKGVTTKQVALLRSRVEKLVAAVKAERLSELSASAIQTVIGDLHRTGKSLQTCQHYLRAAKQFSRWLHRDGRVRDDALAHLTGYNAATDRRHERRPLTAAELPWLIDSAERGPKLNGLTGPARSILYQVATGTGFRASELRSLVVGSFDLEASPPAITLRAVNSKRRRDDLQPIRLDLAALLRPWLAGKPANAPLWPGRWHEKAARMIRADLRRARAHWITATPERRERRERRRSDFLAVVDGAGCVVDFHALRVTYITMLVKGGASVREAQQLARHSDPKLTLNTYSKLGKHDLAGALENLPSAAGDTRGREAAALQATGTESARAQPRNDHW